MEKQEKKTAPKFDSAKSSKTGDALAALITGTVAKSHPQSIAEGLLIITLAVGRAIQVLGTIMGVDPKSEIAGMLYLSPETVNNHIRNIYYKLGVHDKAEFIRYANDNSIFDHNTHIGKKK